MPTQGGKIVFKISYHIFVACISYPIFVACMHWKYWGINEKQSLLPWLKNTFEGVEKILTGKKNPYGHKRALKFATLRLLRNHVEEMGSFENLDNFLESCLL